MLISNQYAVAADATLEDGMIARICPICKGTFAVPTNVDKELPVDAICDKDSCKEAADKAATANATVDTATNDATDAEMKKALGD